MVRNEINTIIMVHSFISLIGEIELVMCLFFRLVHLAEITLSLPMIQRSLVSPEVHYSYTVLLFIVLYHPNALR